MSRSDDLHAAAFTLTPLVLDKKYRHMKKPFEMLLGGLIIPALVEDDPDVLKAHPEYAKLLEQYTTKRVIDFFRVKPATPTPRVTKVEPEVDLSSLEIPVKTPEEVFGTAATKVMRPTAEKVGGKYRRLKLEGVDKVRRFERDLEPADRDALIRWWNDNQRLVPEADPVCKKLADELNTVSPAGMKPLSPLQMAGYFSYLCRLGMWSPTERDERIYKSIARGRFTVPPQYSAELVEAIVDNYNAEKADEKIRKVAHARKLAARSSGAPAPALEPAKTATPAEPEPGTDAALEESDTFDIKFAV